MKLDLSAFEQAVQQLSDGLRRAEATPEDELLRDGAIQRFEYTYELCHKMLKRYLELTEASPDAIDLSTFQNLIRLGSERGILRNGWDIWRNYRASRGATSHTYDKEKAKEVFEQIPAFLEDASALLVELQERQSSQ